MTSRVPQELSITAGPWQYWLVGLIIVAAIAAIWWLRK